METIVLKNTAIDGSPLEVSYLPGAGMNMISFKKGHIEVIDQTTKALFEERFAGLGALIGPHFHHRRSNILPPIRDETLFPHIARIKAKGIQEPFSHGIARYAPWQAEVSGSSVKGILTGKDVWNGVPLSELEGQNFTMRFFADLQPNGLHLDLSVVSDSDSLVGIHYYYRLPQGKGIVRAQVKKDYRMAQQSLQIPAQWMQDQDLVFSLDQGADFTFHPQPDPCGGKIVLITDEYTLTTSYESASEENAWQLYHPKGSSFVCIEPMSAQDPHHPNLTVSSLRIHLEIA